MVVARELKWLTPYLEIAKKYIKTSHIKSVYLIPPQRGKVSRGWGTCLKTEDSKQVHIGLCVEWNKARSIKKGTIKTERLSKIDILETLAHELAHVRYWKHSPRHKLLQSEIQKDFMHRLHATGYTSEEKEFAK